MAEGANGIRKTSCKLIRNFPDLPLGQSIYHCDHANTQQPANSCCYQQYGQQLKDSSGKTLLHVYVNENTCGDHMNAARPSPLTFVFPQSLFHCGVYTRLKHSPLHTPSFSHSPSLSPHSLTFSLHRGGEKQSKLRYKSKVNISRYFMIHIFIPLPYNCSRSILNMYFHSDGQSVKQKVAVTIYILKSKAPAAHSGSFWPWVKTWSRPVLALV